MAMPALAHDQKQKSFDVCINPATDLATQDDATKPGAFATVAANIVVSMNTVNSNAEFILVMGIVPHSFVFARFSANTIAVNTKYLRTSRVVPTVMQAR
jgi:hypothetical protein